MFFLAREGLNIFPDVISRLRVEAERRLVEEENPGRVKERAGDLEPALHAAGEGLGEAVLPVPEADEFQGRLDARGLLASRDAVEYGVKLHVLAAVISPSRLGSWKTMPKERRAARGAF